MGISISFLGAAKTVTGSSYLVETDNTKFIVDAGMFQGPEVEILNFEDYDFNPAEVDFVLLTHTHLDHCGMLPKLTKHGFRGPIYSTLHTAQLASIILLDSAKIQENNYREKKPWTHSGQVEMVYGTPDAQQAISQFKTVDFGDKFEPVPGIEINYIKAGHVLGAASIEADVLGTKIVFSGDIGRQEHVVIGGFDLGHKAEPEYVLMEALYGGQEHPKRGESVGELVNHINKTLERGGSVFIPCFAVQRTQEILHDIKIAKQSGAIANEVPVWLDSPMAQRVTEVYHAAMDHEADSLFNFPQLNYVQRYRQSTRISKKRGQIIIAGSGMASGGRILGHLASNLENKKNSVIFVGYQAEETLGRELVEGAKQVVIDDHSVAVKADIYHLHGFSAHGDSNDYLAWLKRYHSPSLKKVFLIHADVDRANAMQEILNENSLGESHIPGLKEKVVLA